MVRPYVCDDSAYLYLKPFKAQENFWKGNWGVEGYRPRHLSHVTSSFHLSGLLHRRRYSAYEITDVVAVAKAYSIAVGAGDLSGIVRREAEELRKRGGDGENTAQPRKTQTCRLV